VSVVAFQTRARTIDHLGRGQIADCPTAVSELWKNAYDAYAKQVGLHIFDGATPIAAVIDDGHGMDYDEFLTRWLVVGTDAKVSGTVTPKDDRNGLPVRERQGEKGIGRLSVAFLGPVVFVISKRKSKPFVAALVDWRLFENPFLLLGDIEVPVQHFDEHDELADRLPGMFAQLRENIEPAAGDGDDEEVERANDRAVRLAAAWRKYSAIQKNDKLQVTAAAVKATAAAGEALSTALLERCLNHWEVWNGTATHGTALFILHANHELSVWVNPDVADEDPEASAIKNSLRETLIGFVDPFVESPVQFGYSVTVHKGDEQTVVVSADRVFSWAELRTLEHLVEGSVDENGVFKGRVKAFGRDLGVITLTPPDRPAPIKARSVVGPFDLCIGTFEQEKPNSSMPDEQHRHVSKMAESYAGLAIYRDALRVMPYGRAQADYFGIEERRSQHHGREFWSYRRTFGRIAISRDDNPNLKDKAGREGLIDNQAKREFRMLVIEILKTTARRFFGSDSQPRRVYLPEIVAENQRAKEAEESTQNRRTAEFRRALRQSEPALASAATEVAAAKAEIKRIVEDGDLGELVEFEKTLQKLESDKTTLKLPAKPAKLGSLEDEYRTYRDRYSEFCATTDDVRREWAEAVEKVKKKPAAEEGKATAAAHSDQIDQMLREWRTKILGLLGKEADRVKFEVQRDGGRYKARVEPLIGDLVAGRSKLPDLVRQLEATRETLHLEFAQRYGGYLRVLENLAQGIDVDALTAWSVEQRQEMQGRVDQLHALAQLGVTIELVGHELETHNEEITRHLNALPGEVQQKKPWRDLRDSIKALFERLRFVTPLQLSGKRFMQDLTGGQIADYVAEFFEARFQRAKVVFTATPVFRAIRIREYPARIYPVFINLVNNSLYWVSMGPKREILLDVVANDIVVADTGRGVDPDDVNSLFQLFFTRRTEGRGVGLYLCRANLAAGGHSIAYATDPAHRILPGANFIIRMRGLQHG
jgi:signal transduction histidine kinase